MSWPGQLDCAVFQLWLISLTQHWSVHTRPLDERHLHGLTDKSRSLCNADTQRNMNLSDTHIMLWKTANITVNLCISALYFKCSSFICIFFNNKQIHEFFMLPWIEMTNISLLHITFSLVLFIMTSSWSVMFYFNKLFNGQFCFISSTYRIHLNMMINIM